MLPLDELDQKEKLIDVNPVVVKSSLKLTLPLLRVVCNRKSLQSTFVHELPSLLDYQTVVDSVLLALLPRWIGRQENVSEPLPLHLHIIALVDFLG